MWHILVLMSLIQLIFLFFKKEGVLRKLTLKKTLKVVFQYFFPVPLYLTSHMVQNNPSFFLLYEKCLCVCLACSKRRRSTQITLIITKRSKLRNNKMALQNLWRSITKQKTGAWRQKYDNASSRINNQQNLFKLFNQVKVWALKEWSWCSITIHKTSYERKELATETIN